MKDYKKISIKQISLLIQNYPDSLKKFQVTETAIDKNKVLDKYSVRELLSTAKKKTIKGVFGNKWVSGFDW